MRRIWSVLLASLLLLTVFSACTSAGERVASAATEPEAVQETAAGVISPMTSYKTLQEMLAATPGINMVDAPEGATDVTYNTITGGNVSPITQIEFLFEGNDYTYRAAVCATEADMKDISGVYDQLTTQEKVATDPNVTDGGSYSLQYSDGSTLGLATWFYAPTGCQYSLFTTTGCGADQKIEEVVDYLLPITMALDGTPLALPQTTLTPDSAKVVGTVEGTVVSLTENEIVINMDNGNTLTFLMSNIVSVDAVIGDKVSIGYSGSIEEAPEAVTITVTMKSGAQISGTVTQHDNKTFYVKTATGNVYGFVLTDKTVVSGKATTITNNASVKVSYTGNLVQHPSAVAVQIVKAGSDKDPLVNKTLDGLVTQLNSKSVYIHTNAGHNYKFVLVSSTKYQGDYSIEVGAKIKVTYDGYASKAPNAKIIKVLAPPDPTPPGPVVYKVTGVISQMAGNMIEIASDDGGTYDFLIGSVTITGDSDCGVGDRATVTYHTESDGSMTATAIYYHKIIYTN